MPLVPFYVGCSLGSAEGTFADAVRGDGLYVGLAYSSLAAGALPWAVLYVGCAADYDGCAELGGDYEVECACTLALHSPVRSAECPCAC